MRTCIEKWEREYIEGVDLNDIEWLVMSPEELREFLEVNYYDSESKRVCEFAIGEDTFFILVFGMSFLAYNNIGSSEGLLPHEKVDYKYLIGVVTNQAGKKTIVAETKYSDCYYFDYSYNPNQEYALTLISLGEVNRYFRGKGVFKEMCRELSNILNYKQHIITTNESEMGAKCHVVDIIRRTMEENGFQNYIYTQDDLFGLNMHEVRDNLFSTPKSPKGKLYPIPKKKDDE